MILILQERQSYTIFPPHDQVWSWTQHFDVKETKVVIIGQDPYHGPMQAHGLCFSVKHGIKPPPSLLNMYKELENDENVCFTRPAHGYLEGWSKQGVLLLNAVLTVRSGQANSHKVQIIHVNVLRSILLILLYLPLRNFTRYSISLSGSRLGKIY